MNNNESTTLIKGILLIDKPQGRTSFSLIQALRRLTGIRKIGHAGTLDPFATGVMVMLIGRDYTRLSDKLLLQNKEYLAEISLGVSTDTYDCDGKIVARSKKIPSLDQCKNVLNYFQGEIEQIPPMYSAKKIGGKKLYELARKGEEIQRQPTIVKIHTSFLSYTYPHLSIGIICSKGTYIRSIAHELGDRLGCGAHLSKLKRIRSGSFSIEECIDGILLDKTDFDITSYLKAHEDYLSA
ncbi:MAG: tRNA pseudouridine(55) synthase TruB [Chlamydiales bacterium]